MWKPKSCPKCGGDMFREWDSVGPDPVLVCLQCAYRRYPLRGMGLVVADGVNAAEQQPEQGGEREWLRYWESTLEQLIHAWP